MKCQKSEETEDAEKHGERKIPKIHKIESPDTNYSKILERIGILTFIGLQPEEIYHTIKNEDKEEKEVPGDEQLLKLIAQEQENYKQHRKLVLEEKKKHSDNLNLQMISSVPEEEYKLHSIFVGENMEQTLALYYLLSKHDNVCTYLPSGMRYLSEPVGVYWTCKNSSSSSTTPKEEFELKVPYIDWALKCTKRFIIFLLNLYGCDLSSAHANMLVYDKKMNTLERFEPHGTLVKPVEFDYNSLDKKLAIYFDQIFPGVKYLSSMNICPRFSFQALESYKDTRLGDPGGFCVAWSLFYLDSRLSNPDIPPPFLLDLLLRELTDPTGMGKKKLVDFIRAYSNFLLQKGLQLLSSRVEKEEETSLEKYLHKSVKPMIEMRRRNPIKVLDGSPWTLSWLRELFKRQEAKAKRKGDHPEWLWYDISTLLEESYEKTVEKLKEKISNLSKLKISNIFFIGNSKNFGRDLFENINADKYYMSNKNNILPYVLSKLLDIDFLETEEFTDNSDKNEIEKILSTLTIDQERKTLDTIISKLLTMVNERNHTKYKYNNYRKNNALNNLTKLWDNGYSSPLDYVKRVPELHQLDLLTKGVSGYKFATDEEMELILNNIGLLNVL